MGSCFLNSVNALGQIKKRGFRFADEPKSAFASDSLDHSSTYLDICNMTWFWTITISVIVIILIIVAIAGYVFYRGYKRIKGEKLCDIPSPPLEHILGHPEAVIHPCKHIYRGNYCDNIGSAFHQIILVKKFILFVNDAVEAGKILTDLPIKGAVYAMFRLDPKVPDLLSSETADWDERIKVLRSGLAGMALGPRPSTKSLLATLKTHSESAQPVDFSKLFQLYSLDVICEQLFGYDLNGVSGSEEGEALYQAFRTRDDKIKSAGLYAAPSNRKVPPEEERDALLRWGGFVRKLQGVVVSEALVHEKSHGELRKDKVAHCLVALARQLHANTAAKSDSSPLVLTEDMTIAAEIHSILRHGFEAIAGTLTWAMYLLYRFPECRAKLEKELIDPLNQGEYLDCVLKETMRRNPVMGNFSVRTVTQPGYRIKGGEGGYVVPVQQEDGGTPINVSIHCLQNTTRTWTDPIKFDPERWVGGGSAVDGIKGSHPSCPFGFKAAGTATESSESSKNAVFSGVGFKDNSLSFFPFSAGNRICKGKDFALNIMRVVISDICKEYRFECAAGEQPEDPGGSFFSSIVPILPDSCKVIVSRATYMGEVPKKQKVDHGWAADSDEEDADTTDK